MLKMNLIVTVVLVALLSSYSNATITADPLAQQLVENNYKSLSTSAFVGQYISTSNPSIASVDVRIFNGLIGADITLNIFGAPAENANPAGSLSLLGSTTVAFATNDNTISSRFDFEGVGGVDVSGFEDKRIFLEFSTSGGGELGSRVPGNYTGGYLYSSTDGGNSWGLDQHSLAFSVRTSDPTLPEPATLGLLGLGGGMFLMRRRQA